MTKGQSEAALQQQCFNHFWNTYPDLRKLLFSVPNEGAGTAKRGKLLKMMGLVAGVSDMLLIYKGTVYCLELKTEYGYQSKSQKDWERRVRAQGVMYKVIYNFEQFKSTIKDIIGR